MFLLERNQQRFSKLLQQYLSNNLRCDLFLQQLSIYFEIVKDPLKLTLESIQNNCINQNQKRLCSPMIALKYLILIHKIISQKNDKFDILQQIIYTIQTKDYSDFDKMLTLKLIRPYKLFLQKRITINLKQFQSSVLSFFLINLLWSAMAFVDIIYTFGRYYVYNYPFFVDFNITIGMDISKVYQILGKSLSKQLKEIMIPQIQKIHQKMYIIYYNCYFHKHLKEYIPKWINTDSTLSSSAQSIKSRKNVKENSVNRSSSFMSQSCLGFDNFKQNILIQRNLIVPKNQEQSRLQVIKSMERIVSLF